VAAFPILLYRFRGSPVQQNRMYTTHLLPVESARKLMRWNPYFTSKYETEFVTWFARSIRIIEFIGIALIK